MAARSLGLSAPSQLGQRAGCETGEGGNEGETRGRGRGRGARVRVQQQAANSTTVHAAPEQHQHQHQQRSTSCTGPTENYGEAGRERNSSPRRGLVDLDDRSQKGKACTGSLAGRAHDKMGGSTSSSSLKRWPRIDEVQNARYTTGPGLQGCADKAWKSPSGQ
ncbi:uncharacterized protein K444DRAFT_630728 [Hyaloscypha bicolor E]|uniref:Uncharacterized protein n=1 Tax=Hyaloscypha bicolor E TaxID=1095630 RepID=A0A2J6T7W1_9HELO|nr:uncharacterized protein K444DRAFT_630728 [Hyaloscypha bicolor E]PMD59104.1 hypothetical protein K444DRAFT_630728 [Hyaloscypha bicolor E]